MIVLCATKIDDVTNRYISNQEIVEFAKSQNVRFFETSAKTGENVNSTFETITKLILQSKFVPAFIPKSNEIIKMTQFLSSFKSNNNQTKNSGGRILGWLFGWNKNSLK